MKSKRSFAINYVYTVISEVITLFVPLITTPYISRVLGANAIGEYGFTSGVVSYFGIVAALGTVNYAKREIAYVQSDEYKRSKIFWELLFYRIITTLIVLFAYIVFIYSFPSQYKFLYYIQLITVLSWLFDVTWLFGGVEDFKVVTRRNVIVKLLSACCIFILVKNETDLWLYTLILSSSLLLGNLSAVPSLRKYITFIPIKELNLFKHTKGILIMFSSVLSVQLYTVLDQTMLGVLSNTVEVGYYTQAQKLIKVALSVIGSFALILLPRIAALYKEKNVSEMDYYLELSFNYLFMVGLPMMVGCIVLSNEFVPLFFGEGFTKVSILLKILSILFVILGLGQLTGTLLTAIDKQISATIAVSCGAVINIILNYFLIRNFSSIGACVSSVIAESVVTTIECVLLSRFISVKSLFYTAKKYIFATLIMYVYLLLISNLINQGWLGLVCKILSAMVIYLLGLILTKNTLIINVINSLRDRLNGK